MILYLHNFLTLLVNITIIIFSVSCVGTLEDTKLEKTKTVSAEVDILEFNGLDQAVAISDSHVELYFKSAGGKSEDLVYKIFINNSRFPVHLNSTSLSSKQQGYFIYTVKNLQINTTYAFSVSALDKKSGKESSKGKTLFATTFMDFTSEFGGVNKLELPNGKRAKDSVIVNWVPVDGIGTLYAKNRDVVGYEITYTFGVDAVKIMNDSLYIGPNKVTLSEVDYSSELPMISKERSREISGLLADTLYYFRVRAIHAGYNKFSTQIEGYKKEENNIIKSIRTEKSQGSFYFDQTTIKLTKPYGEKALNTHEVKWQSATGDIDHYKVIVQEVESFEVSDKLTTEDIDIILLSPSLSNQRVDSREDFYIIKNLESYRPYQIKFIICGTPQCDSTNRLESELFWFDTFPILAPFEGISSIDSPLNFPDVAVSRVHLNFTPPSTNLGYLTALHFYCYSSPNDENPVELIIDKVTESPSKENCNGVKLVIRNEDDSGYIHNMPEKQEDYFNFSKVSIEGAIPGQQYCFSGIATIDGINSYGFKDIKNIENANIKCIIPEVKVPSIVEFPGRKSSCIINDNSLGVSWDTPTGGIYQFFSVFWKLKDLRNPFNFLDATINESVYKYEDQIEQDKTIKIIDNLTPGKEYEIGVLTYYVDPISGKKIYSEFNASIGACSLPNPKFEFEEWEQVFAIGPKINGLSPDFRADVKKEQIVETLDNDIPIEVMMSNQVVTSPDPSWYLYDNILPGNASATDFNSDDVFTGFDGAYGAMDDTISNGLFKFSNSGIVKISWQDVTFYNGKETLISLIELGEQGIESDSSKNKNLEKNDRTSGYKVYRSIDNRLSWVELTSEGYKYQDKENSGFILPKATEWKPRVNAMSVNRNIASFIDYSVSAITPDDNGINETARIYWYKIVPFFNDVQLTSDNVDNIIKVVLPPSNMALVNRKIANKTFCNSIGMIWEDGKYVDNKPILKDESSHYACYFNGVGSSGLELPWIAGKTVYDIGGDMLVDRFGLGCNFSRGGLDQSESDYDISKGLENFKGKNESGSDLIGCTGKGNLEYNFPNQSLLPNTCKVTSSTGYLPNNVDPSFSPLGIDPGESGYYCKNFVEITVDRNDESWRHLGAGDCIGNSNLAMSISQCDGLGPEFENGFPDFVFPGAHGGKLSDCTDAKNTYYGASDVANIMEYPGFNFSKIVSQSSLGSVFHDQSPVRFHTRTIAHLKANRIESDIEQDSFLLLKQGISKCSINLSAVNANDNIVARWISLNALLEEDGLKYGDNNLGTLYNRSLIDIKEETSLYGEELLMQDISSFRSSSFMETPLLRLMVSNDSKLPFISDLKKESFHKICSMFSVNVGYKLNNGTFIEVKKTKTKEVSTRKKMIALSTWPSTFNESMINGISEGENCQNNENGKCIEYNNASEHDGNNSCNVNKRYSKLSESKLISGSVFNSRFSGVGSYNTITGSSPLDDLSSGGLYSSTQNCISKYGVQDVLGNYKNYLSDEIYCDPNGEQMMLGVENNPFLSLPSSNENEFIIYNNELTVWSQPAPDTGRCSFVAVGDDSSLEYRLGSRFHSIFEPGGVNVNSSIITKQKKYDQKSVDDMRNGNGQFLSFGQRNIGPPLSQENSLSFVGNSNIKFFAPAVGITLSCIDNACDYENDDNMTITTDSLFSSITNENELEKLKIRDFPVGGTVITNESMSSLSSYVSGVWPNGKNTSFRYIDTLDIIDNPPNLELSSMNYVIAGNGEGQSSDAVTASRTSWLTPREIQYDSNGNILYKNNIELKPKMQIKLLMIGGSDYLEQNVGIYSLKIKGNNSNNNKYFSENVTARCSVILEE